ncbi:MULTISPECIES: type I-E CRISPR-associated protein Cas6/Cse3/CasE [unclassified Streptomyces]|uniref:type I-E CRISPR-associated protein Cas6/Cse3/CasE n=1 Tax=unclassified Streptomyces TaxID=2593676 RepID=UPI002473F09B|nr:MULTISPECIES: type I-E CRISPR-associated protein Cas6/Cse3/CasE [unclassified Streptomyces]MDH6454382.1 CRISPR system Cascade subunit CasE [Streptomyces sp. SAI-119]MDH6495059.1 CRISPR system Cascade subunit CasE [Streptomyces sp. SAI-149]
MYLSRFRMNAARPGARRLLSSPQSLHAAVMSSFPHLLPTASAGSGAPSEGPRVLWRLDHNASAEVFLYVVSPDRPDLTHLVEQAGWPAAAAADPDNPGWQSRPYAPFLDRLAQGSTWAFRLTANPVHHIRRKDDEPIKRTAHVTPVHQMAWLLERQERCGFRICEKPDSKRLLPGGTTHKKSVHHGDRYELMVRDQRNLSFAKSRGDNAPGRRPVTLVAVTFDGRLQITDSALLRRTLVQGLGKAKAYGCGLMTLAPVPDTGERTP